MSNSKKINIRYLQEYINTDPDIPDSFLVLIECHDGTPVKAYIVKMPPRHTWFFISPYIFN